MATELKDESQLKKEREKKPTVALKHYHINITNSF